MVGRVLVVDDEPMILEMLKYLLQAEGLKVETALSAAEGLEHLSLGEPFDVVITDHNLEGMSGPEFVREHARRLSPAAVLVTSGDLKAHISPHYEGLKVSSFIEKPFGLSEFIALVISLIGKT